jgi:hypothetical protein
VDEIDFMIFSSQKSQSRRTEIHKNRPDTVSRRWDQLKANGVLTSLGIAVLFCIGAVAILMLRSEVVPYRPGQYAPHDIVSRVDFQFLDKQRLADAQRRVREMEPRVYRANPNVWKPLEETLLGLPDQIADKATLSEVGQPLRKLLDTGTFMRLKEVASDKLRPQYATWVKSYITAISQIDPNRPQEGVVILREDARQEEIDSGRSIAVEWTDPSGVQKSAKIPPTQTFAPKMQSDLEPRFDRLAGVFEGALRPKIVALTLQNVKPTHTLDDAATVEAQNEASPPPRSKPRSRKIRFSCTAKRESRKPIGRCCRRSIARICSSCRDAGRIISASPRSCSSSR